MSKLIVGIIGYRNHSYKIISNLSKNKSIKKIFSFCYKKKKIKSLNKNNKIKILQYISDLRKLGQCNSIFISSATKTHFKYIKKFINKDTYIYCEKPGPTNLKQINFLKKLPNKIKKKIYFGHNLLHSEIYSYLKKILKKKSMANQFMPKYIIPMVFHIRNHLKTIGDLNQNQYFKKSQEMLEFII